VARAAREADEPLVQGLRAATGRAPAARAPSRVRAAACPCARR
jgi:hypothetical protein